MKSININIDVAAFCKVRCPTCPVGGGWIPQHKEFIQPATLEAVLQHVTATHGLNTLSLYDWSDSYSHPLLATLVRIGKRYARLVSLSTTGNYRECDLAGVAHEKPHMTCVAISGWTQEVYRRHQPGGDVNAAKSFLADLAAIRHPNLTVNFHRYRDNLHEEATVRRYARRLGFKFNPIWAGHHPTEDIIFGMGFGLLAMPIADQLAFMRDKPHYPCTYHDECLSIAINGDVRRCSPSGNMNPIGNILHDSVDTLLHSRDEALCAACRKVHAYQVLPGIDRQLEREIARRNPGSQIKYFLERMKHRVWFALVNKP